MCQCCSEKKDIYLPELATVVKADAMNVTERYLQLAMDDGQFDYTPGQFVEVSLAGIGEALPWCIQRLSSSLNRAGSDSGIESSLRTRG